MASLARATNLRRPTAVSDGGSADSASSLEEVGTLEDGRLFNYADELATRTLCAHCYAVLRSCASASRRRMIGFASLTISSR
jgi:hypothetical protein